MICTAGLTKKFSDKVALEDVNLYVPTGCIYGLVGTNGSGKTTLLKHLTGIYKSTEGKVFIDEDESYENEVIKQKVCFIPDELYFFETYSLKDMGALYSRIYENWDQERFQELVKKFKLNENQRINRFSKGMQKQAAFALAMAAKPSYLILDEPVDGLDPIMRHLVWEYIIEDVSEREMTAVISSHNLKEIEGVCDTVGILDQGKLVIQREIDDLKTNVHKIQVVFKPKPENPYENIDVLKKKEIGSVDVIIARGVKEDIQDELEKYNPVILDILPLTLEEIFIYELGGLDNE